MEKNEPNDNDIATCHSNHNPESYINDNFNQALFFYSFLGRDRGEDWKNSSVMLWEENGGIYGSKKQELVLFS